MTIVLTGGRFVPVPHAMKMLPKTGGGGTSNPRFCEFDDGITRLVRWHKSGPKSLYQFSHGPKSCFNEFVASKLSLLIGAPVLTASVVFVSRKVISKDDSAYGAVPGFHSGVPKISGSDFAIKDQQSAKYDKNATYRDISKVANMDELTAAAVLLAWLRIGDHAMDPDREGVPEWDNGVFIESRIECGAQIERYVLVDLEDAFGTAEWTCQTLGDEKGSYVLPKHLKEHLEKLSEDTRNAAFQKLGTLEEVAIRECFSSYPEEWCGTVERERAIEWTLLRARLLGRWFALNNCTVEVNYDPLTRYP